jgi:hypothetical protein
MRCTYCESGAKRHETESVFQRYRIAVIERWAESEYKGASLAAAQATLRSELIFEAACRNFRLDGR